MQNNKLVSIITPCYNGEQCLGRMLDSVIAQTYRPIEYILVNDGSTDGTQKIAESYIPKFKRNGISYTIVQQENKGLAGAINAGLKRFTGDYLCWSDADDYLEPTSVEDRVMVLEKMPDYAVVSSDAYIRDCDNIDEYKVLSDGLKHLNDPNQFEHHLNGESIFCPGCHMARTSMFLEVHPDREIYPARRGQNWQLLLPLYYKYKWVFLNKPLYNYIVSPNSMSKDKNTLDAALYRYNEHEEIITNTLEKIEIVQNADMSRYIYMIRDRYAKRRMEAALKYNDKDIFRKEFESKRGTIGIDKEDKILLIRSKNKINNILFGFVMKIMRKIKKD